MGLEMQMERMGMVEEWLYIGETDGTSGLLARLRRLWRDHEHGGK